MSETQSQHTGKRPGNFFGILIFGILAVAFSSCNSPDYVASELATATKLMNKETPMQIDEYTRLDSVASEDHVKVIYYYTLFGKEEFGVDYENIEIYIRPSLVETIKTSPEMAFFRQNNIIIEYRYRDQKGARATELIIKPEDYKL